MGGNLGIINYRMQDGVRVSHTIDPRTLEPVMHNLASVTVIAETAAIADAWATALFVLGPMKYRVGKAIFGYNDASPDR